MDYIPSIKKQNFDHSVKMYGKKKKIVLFDCKLEEKQSHEKGTC